MQVPLRLEVLKRLSDGMEQITVSNGYQHDLTNAVFRGRAVFGEGDPIPMVSILEVPLPEEQFTAAADSGVYSGPWELVIQGFCQDDKKNPTDPAHYLLADVKRRLAEMKRERGRHEILGPWGTSRGVSPIENIYIGPGVVRPPDEVSYTAYFWLTIRLNLVDDLTAPFTF